MSDLWRLSAVETARLVRDKEVSARGVAESALARLADVNPAINAVVQELPDEALPASSPRAIFSSMFCIPMPRYPRLTRPS